jgi:pantoate--beta-alanine ligase
MKIFHQLDEWIAFRNTLPSNTTIGFAPTMGNLHVGHVSLFKRSKEENDITVSSLFVNPTQFNQPEDYHHYPRTLEQDLEQMSKASVDYCILPDEQSLYVDGYTYQIQEHKIAELMEGMHRPGHFNGVLTVVMKLFNLTRPHKVYFGEKDYQQYRLIQGMIKAFLMPIDIVPCPTIREASGLAYSSRNNRLNKEQRILAEQFAKIFHQPHQSCDFIAAALMQLGIQVDYVSEHENRRFIAVSIGGIRLIDNYSMTTL